MNRFAPVLLSLAFAAPAFAQQDTAPAAAPADPRESASLHRDFNDPWERFNRPMYRFNRAIDKAVLRPVARGYQRITPGPLRRGISNFFDNLQQPITTVNLLLQGHPIKATASLGRFALNSTFGIGGIFDPADEAKIPDYDADFGQTFHRWGWKKSRYVVLPVFGPATVRDAWGKGVNRQVSPITWLADREGSEISILYGIDARARGLAAESLLEGSPDEYALVRDAYLQRRRCQLIDCSEELPDYLLPEYEIEIPDIETFRER